MFREVSRAAADRLFNFQDRFCREGSLVRTTKTSETIIQQFRLSDLSLREKLHRRVGGSAIVIAAHFAYNMRGCCVTRCASRSNVDRNKNEICDARAALH